MTAHLFEVALAACDGALSMCPRDVRAAVVSEIVHRFPDTPARERLPALTPMESRVLRMVASGVSSEGIQAALGMGERTVNTHRASIRAKLNAHSMPHAIAIAYRAGVLS